MRRLLTIFSFASLAIATPALAADVSPSRAQGSPTTEARAVPAPKRVTSTMHYPTLERMLRRFSREAGESRKAG